MHILILSLTCTLSTFHYPAWGVFSVPPRKQRRNWPLCHQFQNRLDLLLGILSIVNGKTQILARESPRYQSVPRMCCRIWACYMILSCSKYSLRPTLMHLITPIKGVTFPLPTFDRHLEVGVETTEEPLPPSNICKHPRHPSHHGIHLRSSSLEGYRTTVCSPNFKTRIIWNGQLEWINKSQAWTFH